MFKPGIHNRIYYYLLVLLAFAVPLHKKFTVLVILLIGINWLLELNFGEKYRRVRESRKRQHILLFAVVYVLFAIGLLYTEVLLGPAGGWFKMEVKLSLLVFPLLFSTIDYQWIDKSYVQRLINLYLIGTLASCLFCTGNALVGYFGGEDFRVFYYKELSMFHHPSYMAMYIAFAVVIILYKMLQQWNTVGVIWKVIWLGLMLFYNAFIITLASKAGIISLGLVYLFSVFYALARKKKILSAIIAAMLIALVCLFMFFPFSYNRMNIARTTVTQQDDLDRNATEGSALRLLIWKSSLEIIGQHVLFGVGTGDVEGALMQKYQEKGITMAVEQRLNAHNQFLQTWLAIGIPGLITLVLMLLLPAWQAFRRYNLIYFLFLFILGFNFIFESMLEAQSGVVFYAFFNVFLFATRNVAKQR